MITGLLAQIVSMVVEQKNHHKHHVLILFTFLVICSLFLTEVYFRFIHPSSFITLHTAVFLIFFCGVWVFIYNLVLGMDLIESKSKEQQAEQRIQLLHNELLLSEEKALSNTNKWLSLLAQFQREQQFQQSLSKQKQQPFILMQRIPSY
jgi:hypothetical protein